jgi:hypothetical protein
MIVKASLDSLPVTTTVSRIEVDLHKADAAIESPSAPTSDEPIERVLERIADELADSDSTFADPNILAV